MSETGNERPGSVADEPVGRGIGPPPTVWALLGHRAGDNIQLETLAEALGWPWQRKRLAWRRPDRKWKRSYGRMEPSLEPLTTEAREGIEPPWPELVLSAGWRSVPVARWIKRESGARLVHLGRPRAPLASFDLVLTTPQYRVPDAANVLHLDGPLTRLSPERMASAAEQWRQRLAGYPRPWIAVLIGGDSPPLRLTVGAARVLGQEINALARRNGGSLLITTGPRTSAAAADAVLSPIDVPSHVYRWSGNGGENPYLAYLALADRFVVTSDSVSMVHEASMTGRPVHLFDLPRRGHWPLRARQFADTLMRNWSGRLGSAYLDIIRGGWICPPRDIGHFHARLREEGRVLPLDDPGPDPAASPPDRDISDREISDRDMADRDMADRDMADRDMGRAVAAVLCLFADRRPRDAGAPPRPG